MSDDSSPEPHSLLVEIAAMTGAVFLLVLVATIAARYVALVSSSLYLIVAVVFIYLPNWWLHRRDLDPDRFGLTTRKWGRGLVWGLGATVLTLLPFAAGYWFWEVQVRGRTFEFQTANLSKWSPRLRGRPDRWGDTTGVWTWSEGRRLHVGLSSGRETPIAVRLAPDRPVEMEVRGPAVVRDDPDGSARHVRLERPDTRAEIVLGRHSPGMADEPERVELSVLEPAGGPIRAGPNGERRSGDQLTIERGWRWIGLWLITQIFFIALPEEYFYRGYLQTRLGDWLRARRRERGDPEEVRDLLGVSEANGLASLAFGLGHLLIPVGGAILATRASVFFPALVFGWLRDRTGTIAAPVVYHAACNLMVLLAAPHFF